MVTLDEYVEARIHIIFADLAKDVANGTVQVDDPDVAAGIPMALFKADCAMVKAWRAHLEQTPGQAQAQEVEG